MTSVSKSMFLRRLSSLLLVTMLTVAAAPELREASNSSATPANQLVVSGNACGPTALLNAFRFGDASWQRAPDALTGDTARQRIYTIIREFGMRPSAHLGGRPRWSRKGVNIADLTDIANEMTRGHYLPQLQQEVLFRDSRETPEKLLRRTHAHLETSLKKGLPPLISLRRYVKRDGSWMALEAHFVTVTSVPRKLDKQARSFAIHYIDPWGGKSCQGTIALPNKPVLADTSAASPCLVAEFPDASVGRKLVRSGEGSSLVPAAIMGRW